MVEIDVEQREVHIVAAGAGEQPWEQTLQVKAVWQASEHIPPREPGDLALLFQPLPLRMLTRAPVAIENGDKHERDECKAAKQRNQHALHGAPAALDGVVLGKCR